MRNTTEIFFFRVWTEKVSDGCGTERKRNNRDPGDRSFTAPGSEEYQGELSEVSSREFYEDTNTEDYVRMILTDEEDVVDGMQKLRTIYPNLMQLEYDNQRTREAKEITEAQVAEEKSELEYFEEFFELQNNHPMLQEQREFVSGLIGKLKENEL